MWTVLIQCTDVGDISEGVLLDKLWPPIQSELCVQIDEIDEHDGVRVTVSNLYREFTLHVC